ncbi:hypothetical protein N7456_001261 [Penicillium angulare]|uniref:Uncharacterized protein n=1 Tax=Penicillium angulare TaxID=116970 RepID=A0A9W9KSN4_9EURO|nr:hypothetical protein N7456_001261 [Penicillium angulare]
MNDTASKVQPSPHPARKRSDSFIAARRAQRMKFDRIVAIIRKWLWIGIPLKTKNVEMEKGLHT